MFHFTENEDLRKELLDEVYAGAFAGGMPAMLLDEDRIRKADEKELSEIAKEYSVKVRTDTG